MDCGAALTMAAAGAPSTVWWHAGNWDYFYKEIPIVRHGNLSFLDNLQNNSDWNFFT